MPAGGACTDITPDNSSAVTSPPSRFFTVMRFFDPLSPMIFLKGGFTCAG